MNLELLYLSTCYLLLTFWTLLNLSDCFKVATSTYDTVPHLDLLLTYLHYNPSCARRRQPHKMAPGMSLYSVNAILILSAVSSFLLPPPSDRVLWLSPRVPTIAPDAGATRKPGFSLLISRADHELAILQEDGSRLYAKVSRPSLFLHLTAVASRDYMGQKLTKPLVL